MMFRDLGFSAYGFQRFVYTVFRKVSGFGTAAEFLPKREIK